MAVKKSTTKAGKTIIPEADMKTVEQYRGFMIACGRTRATNEQAYQYLLKERQQLAAKASEAAAEQNNCGADATGPKAVKDNVCELYIVHSRIETFVGLCDQVLDESEIVGTRVHTQVSD